MRQETRSQQQRAGVDDILARIASDPAFRRQLLADPARSVGVADRLPEPPEVVGYRPCKCTGGGYSCRVSSVTR